MDGLNDKIKKTTESIKFMDKKQKMYIYFGLGGLAFIILIAIASCALKPKYKEYTEVEDMMVDAAKDYFKEEENTPPSNGEERILDATTLVDGNYLKSFSKLVENGSECTGEVKAIGTEEGTEYTPYLFCGSKYFSQESSKKIATLPLVVSGDGLYQVGNEYVFRGQYVDNFVKFANTTWRIVKVTEDDRTVLMLFEPNKKKTYAYDDRYNIERKSNSGINNYDLSRLKETLNTLYEDDTLFTDTDRDRIEPMSLCIGNRGKLQTMSEGKVECQTLINDMNIGLMDVYDYMYASLDPACTSPNDLQCQNYNYLAEVNKMSWWTLTGNADATTHAYRINSKGAIEPVLCSTRSGIRYVVSLNDKTFFQGGSGTLEDPYVVRTKSYNEK